MFEFQLGTLLATRGINDKATKNSDFKKFVKRSLFRYMNCDWGDSPDCDKKHNDIAVKNGDDRIFAAYIDPASNLKIWIITEWDRSATTILFPNEY